MLTGFTLLCFMILAYTVLVPFLGVLVDMIIDVYVQEFGPFSDNS